VKKLEKIEAKSFELFEAAEVEFLDMSVWFDVELRSESGKKEKYHFTLPRGWIDFEKVSEELPVINKKALLIKVEPTTELPE
jgi:hypothetical protein